jgi:hypothetical protein
MKDESLSNLTPQRPLLLGHSLQDPLPGIESRDMYQPSERLLLAPLTGIQKQALL